MYLLQNHRFLIYIHINEESLLSDCIVHTQGFTEDQDKEKDKDSQDH